MMPSVPEALPGSIVLRLVVWRLGSAADHEPHLAPLTAAATVFAYPSLYEGFGFPVAQAMAAGTPVITALDLGGGWLPSDLKLAGQCFGYTPPAVGQAQGDGVPAAIKHADDETSLDLQTVAAVAPR